MKYYFKIILKFLSMFLFYIPSKILIKDCIILCSNNYENYNGNSRFLYEYLSKHSKYKVYWVTNNKKLINYLNNRELKYITHKNIFGMLYVTLKSKVIINSGDSYFNILGLIDLNRTKKISLLHGQGPKTDFHCSEPIIETPTGPVKTKNLIKRMHEFDLINFPSEFTSQLNGRKLYNLPDSKIITFGYPKNDQLIEAFVRNKSLIKRENINIILDNNIDNNAKIILYTPTWRPYKSSGFELEHLSGFNASDFSNYLKKNNIYLIFSSHPIMDNRVKFSDRVINLSNHETLVDINNLMLETDILINDYSTTSIDFCITSKAQVFCLPDHDKYTSYVKLPSDYLEKLPGNNVSSYNDLKSTIDNILNNYDEYIKKYTNEREEYLKNYYDCKNNDSCLMFNNLINNLD